GRPDRSPSDDDQCRQHAPDRRGLRFEAQHKEAPRHQHRRTGEQRRGDPARGPHLGSNALNCSSSRIVSFSFWAFSSFEPAPGPATTKSVFELTLPAALPPSLRTSASASGRLIVSSVPVNTNVLPVKGPSPTASTACGSTPTASSLLTSSEPGPWKYMCTSRAMFGPTPSTRRRSSSVALRKTSM